MGTNEAPDLRVETWDSTVALIDNSQNCLLVTQVETIAFVYIKVPPCCEGPLYLAHVSNKLENDLHARSVPIGTHQKKHVELKNAPKTRRIRRAAQYYKRVTRAQKHWKALQVPFNICLIYTNLVQPKRGTSPMFPPEILTPFTQGCPFRINIIMP